MADIPLDKNPSCAIESEYLKISQCAALHKYDKIDRISETFGFYRILLDIISPAVYQQSVFIYLFFKVGNN